jgi:hypothetical protein
MTSTFRNSFHRYEATIRHRSEVPAYSTLRRHIRASRPSECKSTWTLIRSDGVRLIAIPAQCYGEPKDGMVIVPIYL